MIVGKKQSPGTPAGALGTWLGACLIRQYNDAVTETVEGFTAAGGNVGIQLLVGFGDGVEEAPDVATLELPVGGFSPFAEDLGDLSSSDGAAV